MSFHWVDVKRRAKKGKEEKHGEIMRNHWDLQIRGPYYHKACHKALHGPEQLSLVEVIQVSQLISTHLNSSQLTSADLKCPEVLGDAGNMSLLFITHITPMSSHAAVLGWTIDPP